MELRTWTSGLLVLASVFAPAEAMPLYDPQLCYILDGFLGLYGLIITGMFIKEIIMCVCVCDLKGQDTDGYAPLVIRDAERGRVSLTMMDFIFISRHRKNEQVYQGLSSAARDTYDSLQMQQLPAR
uniref:T-cell surface glycoprotein CD3 zeta chain n=1 Tax=Seriola lalandi dorsalis TaxID=1841481 RepID=A0A3B4XUG3_SERLL